MFVGAAALHVTAVEQLVSAASSVAEFYFSLYDCPTCLRTLGFESCLILALCDIRDREDLYINKSVGVSLRSFPLPQTRGTPMHQRWLIRRLNRASMGEVVSREINKYMFHFKQTCSLVVLLFCFLRWSPRWKAKVEKIMCRVVELEATRAWFWKATRSLGTNNYRFQPTKQLVGSAPSYTYSSRCQFDECWLAENTETFSCVASFYGLKLEWIGSGRRPDTGACGGLVSLSIKKKKEKQL